MSEIVGELARLADEILVDDDDEASLKLALVYAYQCFDRPEVYSKRKLNYIKMAIGYLEKASTDPTEERGYA